MYRVEGGWDMKKFSQLNLIHNAVVSGTGEIINRFFESKYVTLYIQVPRYDFLRGKVLVSDINELLDEDIKPYTLEELFQLLFEDLLKQMAYGDLLKSTKKQAGFDLETMANFFMNKKEELFIDQSQTEHALIQETDSLFTFEDRIISKKVDKVEFPLRLLKKIALRGEVFLYDMAEVCPGFDLTLEESITIHYCHVMKSVKQGDHNVLRRILMNLKN